MREYPYTLNMLVRFHECDMQGIVNNAVYQTYLEHARHQYLKTIGVDFADYARRGINFVLTRTEIDYRYPLTVGDEFYVGIWVERESKVKYAFYQDIYRASDERKILSAKVVGTALNSRGRPEVPHEVERALAVSA